MVEPDFSESQLQQLANTEIFNLLRARGIRNSIPRLISLIRENDLGWDTGFNIPWFGRNIDDQYGCNFFIQYKLSNIYSTRGAYGWDAWQRSFYRFNLGYQRNREWDFSQRNHLIDLANAGFSVVYITNHVLRFNDLASIAVREGLCSDLPVLIVDDELSQHQKVSFTSNSRQFALHSDEKHNKKVNVNSTLFEIKTSILSQDVDKILDILIHYEQTIGIKAGTIEEHIKTYPNEVLDWARFYTAGYFLKRYLNLLWIRYESDKE
jgi:hypothetical protein